jgi:hypothetical protein
MEASTAVAVEGDPGTTADVAAEAPSSVKVTVPVGRVVPMVVGVMVVDTDRELPPAGAVVAGVIVIVVGILGTVTVTCVAVELA